MRVVIPAEVGSHGIWIPDQSLPPRRRGSRMTEGYGFRIKSGMTEGHGFRIKPGMTVIPLRAVIPAQAGIQKSNNVRIR